VLRRTVRGPKRMGKTEYFLKVFEQGRRVKTGSNVGLIEGMAEQKKELIKCQSVKWDRRGTTKKITR